MNQTLITAADLDGVMAAALATGLLSSLCTIQQPDGLFGPSGAPSGTYADVSGLVGIRCQAAPIGVLSGTEQRIPPEILSRQPTHVLLESYYPQITTKMIAIVDSIRYDISAVEHDSQGRMTRLLVTRNTL